MISAIDPVECRDGAWYFWNESWSDYYGPYKTEAIARASLAAYCLDFLDHGEYQRPTEFSSFVGMLVHVHEGFDFIHKSDQYIIVVDTLTFYFSSDTGKLLSI